MLFFQGWWKGEVDGKIGVFPDNFVKMIETPKPTPTQQPNNKPSTEVSYPETVKNDFSRYLDRC